MGKARGELAELRESLNALAKGTASKSVDSKKDVIRQAWSLMFAVESEIDFNFQLTIQTSCAGLPQLAPRKLLWKCSPSTKVTDGYCISVILSRRLTWAGGPTFVLVTIEFYNSPRSVQGQTFVMICFSRLLSQQVVLCLLQQSIIVVLKWQSEQKGQSLVPCTAFLHCQETIAIVCVRGLCHWICATHSCIGLSLQSEQGLCNIGGICHTACQLDRCILAVNVTGFLFLGTLSPRVSNKVSW